MNKEKGGFLELRKNTYFWLVFVVLTLATYLLQAGTFVNYKSQINILLIPKNEKTASNIEFVKNNLEYLFDDEYRRRGIDDDIKTISQKDNTIITFEVSESDPKKLRSTDRKVVQDFFDTASAHYDIKDDLEMRLVGDVVVESQPKNFALMLLISAVAGFVIAVAVFWITEIVDGIISKLSKIGAPERILRSKEDKEIVAEKEVVENVTQKMDLREEMENRSEKAKERKDDEERKKGLSAIERLYSSYDQNESFKVTEKEDIEIKDIKKEEKVEEKKVEKKEAPKSEAVGTQKGAAPANLPIGDNIVIIGGDEEESNGVNDPVEPASPEPTNDEYKKRLNQLLKGNL